jgi:glyoxylase-like metal-dependent hydrolase (beta-lactamase superfamily II)
MAAIGISASVALTASAQPQSPPTFGATKVDGTENVYIFRYLRHQSMFIVTPQGTKAPIKYVIYSHSHFDHIAGGQPFKDLGATFIAHKNAKVRIVALNPPDVVVPDQVIDNERTITLGGTKLELIYLGKNHSDSTLVMRLPKEKIIFTVDWIPLETVPFRGMADTYLPDIMEGLKKVIAMDWDRLIPGHPSPDGRQIGTKDDARAALSYLQDLSAAVKQAAEDHRCLAQAMREIKLPKYEKWANYDEYLPMNIERFCDFFSLGI